MATTLHIRELAWVYYMPPAICQLSSTCTLDHTTVCIEGTSEVFFILLRLLALLQSCLLTQINKHTTICANCAICRLHRTNCLCLLHDRVWLLITWIRSLDTIHLWNHTNPLCHTTYSPQPLKEAHPSFNTQAGKKKKHSHGWDDLNTLHIPWQRLTISFAYIEWM